MEQHSKEQHKSHQGQAHPHKQYHPWKVLTAAVIFFLLACVFFVAVRVYWSDSSDAFTHNIAKNLHLPIAFAAGKVITFNDYYARMDIAQKLSSTALSTQNKSDLMTQLINDVVVQKLLAQKNISVTAQEFQDYYQSVKKVTLTPGYDFKKLGVSEQQFENTIVQPDYARIKLQTDLAKNQSINPTQYALADHIQKLLAEGAKFSDFAQEYSQDQQSAEIGGEMGFVGSNDVVQEMYATLTDIKDHNIHVIASRYGVHVVQVEGQDQQGPEKSTRYNIRQIFLKTADFDQWFANQIKNFKITRLK